LACLQALSIEDVALAVPFQPRGSIDDGRSENPVLPDSPDILLQSGDFNQVPVILGSNSGDGSLFMLEVLFNPGNMNTFDAAWEDLYGPQYLREREAN